MLPLLFIVGLASLFIWPPLGVFLLLLCFFGLLFTIADRNKPEEAAQAAYKAKEKAAKAAQKAKEQEQDDNLTDLRSAAKVLEAKAKKEGEGSPAALAHLQVAAELEKEEALAAERSRRKAEEIKDAELRRRKACEEARHKSKNVAPEQKATVDTEESHGLLWASLVFMVVVVLVTVGFNLL